MENITDHELVNRIKRSDRLAFFLFLKRHWKTLYTRALEETGDGEDSFEQVYRQFAKLWDQRRRLPVMDSGIHEYFAHALSADKALGKDLGGSKPKNLKIDMGRLVEGWSGSFSLKINNGK